MSRLHVVHTTTFRYSAPVFASYNEARMKPATLNRQTLVEAGITVQPQTWMHEYRDYWGTAVTAFEILTPHTELTITAESRVEVPPVAPTPICGWDVLETRELRDRMAEYLAHTPITAVPDEVAELAGAEIAGRTPAETAVAVCLALREAMEYVPGVTTVHTAAADAWAARTGVCQDMAHLAAGALRRIGIPARYVSGYFHSSRDGAQIGDTVTGESHAWIEWWAGDWRGYDPTNGIPAGEEHVVLARGREYADVAPLKGVFDGEGTAELTVDVQMTREA